METSRKAISPFSRISRRILKHTKEISWFTWASGFFLGALTNVYPIPSIIIFGIITVIFAVLQIYEFYKSEHIVEFNDWELSLRQPDQFAVSMVNQINEDYLIVGQAIEVLQHPELNSLSDIKNLGWDPEEVELRDLQTAFNASELLEEIGGIKTFDPPNGKKYSLVKTSFVTSDSPILTLDLSYTDYSTLQSILPTITKNSSLRLKFGNLDPTKNRIPHSLCLHYIVRFSDGNILCLKRDTRAAYHGGLWSFSGEEQLSERDFQSVFSVNSPCEALFVRTLCEEVLPLREKTSSQARLDVIKQVLDCQRIFSLFVEEGIFNFSIFGVYQLKININEFGKLHNKFNNSVIGNRDKEGDLYYVHQNLLETFLSEDKCTVEALFDNSQEVICAKHLHPTSRYRIFRLIRAIHRRPLKPKIG